MLLTERRISYSLFSLTLSESQFMFMVEAEKSHVASISSKTGVPMLVECASSLMTINALRNNVIDLAGFSNDHGNFRNPSIE